MPSSYDLFSSKYQVIIVELACEFPHCEERFFNFATLDEHLRSHFKSTYRPFTCTAANCTAKFRYRHHYEAHLHSHTSTTFTCRSVNCGTNLPGNILTRYPAIVLEHYLQWHQLGNLQCIRCHEIFNNVTLFGMEEHYCFTGRLASNFIRRYGSGHGGGGSGGRGGGGYSGGFSQAASIPEISRQISLVKQPLPHDNDIMSQYFNAYKLIQTTGSYYFVNFLLNTKCKFGGLNDVLEPSRQALPFNVSKTMIGVDVNHLIIFRDGDEQSKKIYKTEIRLIQTVINRVGKPTKVILIVNQKCHNIRFAMTQVNADGQRLTWNVSRGTVVNNIIVGPMHKMFYLDNYFSPLYVILHDDLTMNADQVQRMTFLVCFNSIHTRGLLAIPTPTRFADLYAWSKLHIEAQCDIGYRVITNKENMKDIEA